MKNEMRILKSRFARYLDKTQEILSVCEEESKKFEEVKPNTRKGTINSMKDTFNSTFQLINHEGRASTGEEELEKVREEDELQNNLNKIRELIREMSKTARLRKTAVYQGEDAYLNVDEAVIRNKEITENLKKFKNETSTNLEGNLNIKNTPLSLDNAPKCQQEITTQTLTPITPNTSNLLNATELVALLEKVPKLIPEEFIHKCQGCDINFGLCTWKYHCRVCGLVFCFYCSWNFDNFLPFYINAVRICNECTAGKKNKCFIKNM